MMSPSSFRGRIRAGLSNYVCVPHDESPLMGIIGVVAEKVQAGLLVRFIQQIGRQCRYNSAVEAE